MVTKAEEAFKEKHGLRREPSSKSDLSGKLKLEKDSDEKSSRKKYSPLEKASNKAKPAGQKMRKVAPEGEKVECPSFKEAHSGIQEEEIKKRRENDGCTHCRIPGHIEGKTVDGPFKYRQLADRRLTTTMVECFVPSSNHEDHE